MKQVMVRAWEIAKEGQERFGGKVSEYFAIALKMAWEEAKKVKAVFTLYPDKRGVKSWVAKIVGTHPTYKFDRQFINTNDTDMMGNKWFELEEGYYQYSSIKGKGYIKVVNGEILNTTYKEVLGEIA